MWRYRQTCRYVPTGQGVRTAAKLATALTAGGERGPVVAFAGLGGSRTGGEPRVPTAQPPMPWGEDRERRRRWFQAFVQRSIDVATVLDEDGTIRFVSSAVTPKLGWCAEDLVGVDAFYSSLACLTQLPLDELKIDRAFIDGVQNQGRDREVVKAIIAMARALDLRVIAEGVETTTRADSVQALGCGVAQGFLFSHGVAEPTAWS